MKNTQIDNRSSSKRIAPLAFSLAAVFAVAGALIFSPSAATQSNGFVPALKTALFGSANPLQSQNSTFYLHGTGPAANPPTLFLNRTAPTATTEKYKDSLSINRNGGNPWTEVGTWTAASSVTTPTLTSLSDLHVWLGLKNSDDQGTYFDLMVEAYKNSTLLTSGQSLCITGVTRNATSAKEVVVAFGSFSGTTFNGTSDQLKLKILTRVGTTAAGGSCGGHSNAVGLRLYFDAISRAARFTATSGTSDTTPPVLTVNQPADNSITAATEASVTGTFSDQSPTTITVNGFTATLQGSNFTANVPLAEGQNTLLVAATDASGNTTEVTRHVVRDSQLPDLFVELPYEGSSTNSGSVTVTGTIADATAVAVTVNGAPSTIANGRFSISAPLSLGANTLNVLAVDAAGNQIGVPLTVNRVTDNTPPTLSVASPANGIVTSDNVVNVSGTATDQLAVSVSVNGMSLYVAPGGAFTGVVHVPSGSTQLTFVAQDAVGNSSQEVRAIVVDIDPPVISNVTPADGATVNSQFATVGGQVSDETSVTVTVNGVNAVVGGNNVFESAGVALNEGVNTITIEATDQAGNRTTVPMLLTGGDVTPPTPPDFFSFKPETRLAFQTLEGHAEPGSVVTISGGVAPLRTEAAFGSGLFAAYVNLAAGLNTLTATSEDAAGNVSSAINLAITSNLTAPTPPAGQPYQINIATGSGQRGLNGSELPRPLIALVTDSQGAPVPNATVNFVSLHGAGTFIGSGNSVQVFTDQDGHATARYTCGAVSGVYLIRADFTGNTSTPANFIAESLEGGNGATAVSGIVLDQNLRALPNALVRIGGQQTRTANDGRFRLENVASGPHHLLEVIGRDQIPLPGRWPNISYDLDVLPGVENSLGRPLFLPRVNEGVDIPVDASGIVTQDVSYELPVIGGEPPIRVTARAGTHVTFPPDVTNRKLSVTRIPTNRVPMVLEEGRASNLYISVQPSGAVFDQPLEITFPNVDHLPPGTETLLMSFDHDAGRYVKVGTGHVSADGRSLTSDPGSGIHVGAWHAFPPDPPQPEVTVLGHIQIANNPAFKNKVLLEAEAWVEGATAILLTTADEADVLNFRATYSLPPDAPPLAKMEASVNAVLLDIEPVIQRVDDDGNPIAGLAPNRVGRPSVARESSSAHVAATVDKPEPLVDSHHATTGFAPALQAPELDIFYGGTTDEYSDDFWVEVDPHTIASYIVSKFDWKVTGAGASSYTPPPPSPNVRRWEVGKLNPYPGTLAFKCVMTVRGRGFRLPYNRVESRVKRIEVGVNTDDALVIGWINPDGVSLTGAGMDEHMLRYYPLDGAASMSSAQKGLTFAHLGTLAGAGRAGSGRTIHPHYVRAMTAAEKRHTLNWMFKFGANFCSKNRCPPTSFASNEAIDAFRQQVNSYKLFNRYQVKYLVENGQFKLRPLAIRFDALIGVTKDPLFDLDDPGEAGPANRREENLGDKTYLINDGTPAPHAVYAFDALMYPIKWNNIGSRIEFGISSGALKRVYNQAYPTYYLFDNRLLTGTRPQASEPSANFNSNPYPPGPAPYIP